MLREQVAELKGYLNDPNAPFGVDLLLPQVGGSARKTNYDYTKGKLNELVDIIIDSGAKLFGKISLRMMLWLMLIYVISLGCWRSSPGRG